MASLKTVCQTIAIDMAKVIVTITVDWEGEKLVSADLQAMKALNTELRLAEQTLGSQIPITHFICPSYFTRTDDENGRQQIANTILTSGALGPNDEIGAHVHSWKSLGLEAGLQANDIQIAPLGVNPSTQPQIYRNGKGLGPDLGYTVPLGVYSQPQITNYLQTTIALLQKYFPVYLPNKPLSFRCGMWVTCDVIFDALRSTSLVYEASALPFNYINQTLRPNYGNLAILLWNDRLWGNTQQPSSQPAYVQNSQSFAQYNTGILGIGDTQISQPKKINGIVEIPDTGALLPITNYALMQPHIDQAFTLAAKATSDVYISLGFHQEDCGVKASFAPNGFPLTKLELAARIYAILAAVNRVVSQSKETKIGCEFKTIQQVGALIS